MTTDELLEMAFSTFDNAQRQVNVGPDKARALAEISQAASLLVIARTLNELTMRGIFNPFYTELQEDEEE